MEIGKIVINNTLKSVLISVSILACGLYFYKEYFVGKYLLFGIYSTTPSWRIHSLMDNPLLSESEGVGLIRTKYNDDLVGIEEVGDANFETYSEEQKKVLSKKFAEVSLNGVGGYAEIEFIDGYVVTVTAHFKPRDEASARLLCDAVKADLEARSIILMREDSNVIKGAIMLDDKTLQNRVWCNPGSKVVNVYASDNAFRDSRMNRFKARL